MTSEVEWSEELEEAAYLEWLSMHDDEELYFDDIDESDYYGKE